MKHVAFFLCLQLIFVVVTPFPIVPACAQLVLNEVLADPGYDWDEDGSVGSRTDEWVEVANLGSSSVELAAYRLGDLSGGYSWRYGFGGTLEPGAVLTVFGSMSQAWQAANGFPVAGLSLNNTGDTVFLYKIEGTDTLVADSYAYAAHEVLDDRSTGRLAGNPTEWRVFDARNPYEGTTPPLGTGCAPTPRLPNDCEPLVPVEETTWGAIKEMFVD